MGATHQYTQGASPDDEPGAGEYGYSLVECWVAEIDRTHLDRGSWQVARHVTQPRPSQSEIAVPKAE
jgi:hypothetical protein